VIYNRQKWKNMYLPELCSGKCALSLLEFLEVAHL
jgi:hypothetical protein